MTDLTRSSTTQGPLKIATPPETAEDYLDLLSGDFWAKRGRAFTHDDYTNLAETIAHVAWAWNNDPENVADLFADDGFCVALANAAVCVLRCRDELA